MAALSPEILVQLSGVFAQSLAQVLGPAIDNLGQQQQQNAAATSQQAAAVAAPLREFVAQGPRRGGADQEGDVNVEGE